MNRNANRQTVDVILTCGHQATYPKPNPVRGQVIYCRRCVDWFGVEKAPAAYHLQCRKCTYSRTYGRDKTQVLMGASKHVTRKSHHIVDVYDGEKRIDTITQDEGQGALPFETTQAERVKLVKEHQRSLRTFVAGLTHDRDQTVT